MHKIFFPNAKICALLNSKADSAVPREKNEVLPNFEKAINSLSQKKVIRKSFYVYFSFPTPQVVLDKGRENSK